jgi:hypothetical protein
MDYEPGFIALYKGTTVSTAQIVAISAEREVVEQFARLLPQGPTETAPRRGDLHLVPEPPPDAA